MGKERWKEMVLLREFMREKLKSLHLGPEFLPAIHKRLTGAEHTSPRRRRFYSCVLPWSPKTSCLRLMGLPEPLHCCLSISSSSGIRLLSWPQKARQNATPARGSLACQDCRCPFIPNCGCSFLRQRSKTVGALSARRGP